MDAVLESFMQREKRHVHSDFSDVQLHGRFYRVDKRLRGDKVEVRYDPFRLSDTVLIYSLKEEYLGKGVLHERQQGEKAGPAPAGKPQHDYLDLLIRQHEAELAKRTQGIDYRQAMRDRPWPFPAFAKKLAQLLGRKGKLTAFSAGELETLQKFHTRHRSLTHHMITAGASDKVFDTEAKGLIHDYASGLPRQINNIATACLIQAAARNVQKINEQLVNDTMAEFQLP